MFMFQQDSLSAPPYGGVLIPGQPMDIPIKILAMLHPTFHWASKSLLTFYTNVK
jgi:hypothetical protein